MIIKKLKKAKYSKSKSIEKKENATLEILLNDSVITQITGGDDDFPNIDGYFHLITESREMSGLSLQIQIKPLLYTKKGKPFTTCKPTLLAHAHDSSTPILLIGVDPKKNIAYWAYISPEFVNKYLEERDSIPDKTISIHFIEKNKIISTEKNYTKEWKKICLHHKNESNDKIISKYLKNLGKDFSQERISPERLNTLQQLIFYRTNTGKFPLIDLTLSLESEIRQSENFDSKSSYIKLLEQIVYHDIEKVIKILFLFLQDKEEKIAEQAKKVILSVSKYNFHILNSLGYVPQRILIDSIGPLLSLHNEKIENFVVEVLQNTLEPGFEGTSNPDVRTITFHRGTLPTTPYLIKIRKDSIDLVLGIVGHSNNLTTKIKAIKALSSVFHLPDHGFTDVEAEKAFRLMIDNESKYIIAKYKKIILDSQNKPIELLPLVYEIECQLVLIKIWKRNVSGLEKLLKILRSSKGDYEIYKLLVGDKIHLGIEESFDVARKQKEKMIESNLNLINKKNVGIWYKRFQKISSFKDYIDYWHFNTFRDFLARIGVQKPEIAKDLLDNIFKDKGPIYNFAGSLMFGLRKSSLDLWDKYVEYIKKEKSTELIIQILQSFEVKNGDNLNIRKKDIGIISEISRASSEFAFLEKENTQLRYQILRCITYVYSADPKILRELLLEQLENYPAFEKVLFDQLGTAVHFKWVQLSDWNKRELNKLVLALVRTPELDYNHEQVIYWIGKVDFDLMMSIYEKRLNREAKKPGTRYTAFPYTFFPEIPSFIAEHPKYPEILRNWISKVNDRRDLYAMDLGKFIHTIGGNALSEVLDELIESGKETNLKRVVSLFPLLETPNFDTCFKIISITDNKDIWSTLAGRMRSTGILSGNYEDDLFGNALKSLRERIKQELETTKNPRVKKFCEQQIQGLDVDIKRSEEDHKKRLQEEREEFESNKDE